MTIVNKKIDVILWDNIFQEMYLNIDSLLEIKNLKVLRFRKFLNFMTSNCKNRENFE